ncbi:hypothetical protein F4780DRAFT_421503 [Xylariomycetidae sp. FL0641]|nr:hypothetical protein F4780DRAFT_421503 [Xylariomycetidae sp. FL0641]
MATIQPVNPYKRDLPFIHRAWKAAVGPLPYSMGIKLSVAGEYAATGEQPARPMKKRRLEQVSSDATPRDVLGHLISQDPRETERTLCVEVLRLFRVGKPDGCLPNLPDGNPRGSSNSLPARKDTTVIDVRCKLTICTWRPQDDEARVLFCDSQLCKFKIFRDDDNVCRAARVMASPFLVPAQKLYVKRDDGEFFLDDRYLVIAELESADDPNWPPRDLIPQNELQDAPTRPWSWVLTGQYDYQLGLFSDGRTHVTVHLRKQAKTKVKLDLKLDMALRWSDSAAGSTAITDEDLALAHTHSHRYRSVLEPVGNGRGNSHYESTGNGLSRDDHDPSMISNEDNEEAITPSRSLRAREKQNYNLKLLSDKARGKERKERKQRKASTSTSTTGSGQVTWVLPGLEGLLLHNFHCMRCYAVHSSFEQLIKHLDSHPEYRYQYSPKGPHIWVIPHSEETLRRMQSAPAAPPELEHHESEEKDVLAFGRLPQGLSYQMPLQVPVPTKRKDGKQLVPRIEQPIYDRLSKSVLEPGSLVDPPPVDDTWLVQKHRDIIRDYSDVHQDEKEYIFEWDAFAGRECITSDPHLRDVYIRFVQSKASWLAASQSRMTEWAKHLNYLKARNALTEATVSKALDIMRHAKPERRPEQEDTTKTSPRSEYRKSASGCGVCGQPVRGRAILDCSNLDCDRPLYHKGCIRDRAIQPVESRQWRCNVCLRSNEKPNKKL